MQSKQAPSQPFGSRPQREADRVASELPVEIFGARGMTRNVSATGVYLETTLDQALGSRVSFVVEVVVHGETLKMVCAGEVVRVERKVGTLGIAVKLASSFFTDTDHQDEPTDLTDD